MATGNQGNQGNKGNQGGGDTSNRGFASMDPQKQRDIASQGGKASHEQGAGHEFSSEEAREAGRKGGQASGGNQGGNNQGGASKQGAKNQGGGNQGGR